MDCQATCLLSRSHDAIERGQILYVLQDLCHFLQDTFNVEIAGGLGPTAGKIWRVSHSLHQCCQTETGNQLKVLHDLLPIR